MIESHEITFCYVLVETGENPLCEATYISSHLLRRLYPRSRIVVFCDTQTSEVLLQRKLPLSELDVLVFPLKVPEALQGSSVRSRFIKTQIRNLIDGPLVFLDADALPLRPFDELFSHGEQFAAVLDRNRQQPNAHMPTWVKPMYQHFCWKYPLAHYFNSGVMYFKDDYETRKMGLRWHATWSDSLKIFGTHQDQPSLNAMLSESGIGCRVMPISYNAMVDASLSFGRNVKIAHYFYGGVQGRFDEDSLLHQLIVELFASGNIDWDRHEARFSRGDCWVHPTNSIRKELVSRRYFGALRVALCRATRRLKP